MPQHFQLSGKLWDRHLEQVLGEEPAGLPVYNLYVGFNMDTLGQWSSEDMDLLFEYRRQEGGSAPMAQKSMLPHVLERLQADELEGNLAGSGNLVVKGKVREAKFNIAGSGDVKADACEAEEVEGNIAGSGDLEAYATRKLKGNIVGSGDIYYKGDPKVESSCLGSGKVKKR